MPRQYFQGRHFYSNASGVEYLNRLAFLAPVAITIQPAQRQVWMIAEAPFGLPTELLVYNYGGQFIRCEETGDVMTRACEPLGPIDPALASSPQTIPAPKPGEASAGVISRS